MTAAAPDVYSGSPMIRLLTRRALLLSAAAATLLLGAGCAKIGYPLRPETIRTGKSQNLRLAVATFADDRPTEQKDFIELERLVGDDAGYYTDYGPAGVGGPIADMLMKHLTFAGSFREVGRVDLNLLDAEEYLKADIKRLAGEYDVVLMGRVTNFYGFDGYTAEGDRRYVHAQAHLVDLKIIRCKDLKLLWSGQAISNIREVESTRKGNEYTVANDMLRDAANKLVADLNRTRLGR